MRDAFTTTAIVGFCPDWGSLFLSNAPIRTSLLFVLGISAKTITWERLIACGTNPLAHCRYAKPEIVFRPCGFRSRSLVPMTRHARQRIRWVFAYLVLAVGAGFGQCDSWESCLRRGDALFDNRLMGEAERAYSDALKIARGFGPNDLRLAGTLNSLGSVATYSRNYSAAEEYYQQAVAIRARVLGPVHPEVAKTLGNLAEMYRRQRRFNVAEPLFARALQINRLQLPPFNPEIAHAARGLADLYRDLHRYTDAEKFYQMALSIWENASGP